MSLVDGASRKRAAPSGHARLFVVHPPQFARIIPLTEAPLLLGREPPSPSAIAFPQSSVSRTHLSIAWDQAQKQHRLKDERSRNGTWLDAATVQNTWTPLADNAVIRMADILMIYERADTGSLRPAPASTAIPGESIAAGVLRAQIARFSADPSPALLIGDTGTGKELLAREVHNQSSRSGPFLAVNCAALSPQLIESQLFGHRKGAFTGAQDDQPGLFRAAEGGSLFLDEIGDLAPEHQAKLLRAIQEREVTPVGGSRPYTVDTRIIAATNRDLATMVEEGAFRRDLYARLCRLLISVPPLKKRRADILGWVHHLYETWKKERGLVAPKPLALAPKACEAVLTQAWPENLRGLERLVHHLAFLPPP